MQASTILPYECNGIKFNSKNRLISSGNGPKCQIQILSFEKDDYDNYANFTTEKK
jgi:hypothetical protein